MDGAVAHQRWIGGDGRVDLDGRREADIARLGRRAAAGRHVALRVGEQGQPLAGEAAGQAVGELVELGLVCRQGGVAQGDVGADLAADHLAGDILTAQGDAGDAAAGIRRSGRRGGIWRSRTGRWSRGSAASGRWR